MKVCLECGKEIDDNHTFCEPCAYVRLEKYIIELYKKLEKKKHKNGAE